MDSSASGQNPSRPTTKRSPLWKRLAIGVGAFLLCYVAVAYLIVPQIWKAYARHRPSFADNPRVTKTSDGHPGDALNVALTGTESELKAIMLAAKWYPADRLGLRSDLRIGVDSVLKRSFEKAPVSKLYLYGRPEDFAFEQPVGNDPRRRHHVRFWLTESTDEDRPIWIGAASYDDRVGLSDTTGQITHRTAADIDDERAHVLDSLQATGGLTEVYKVPGFHEQLEGKNGGGDPWHTDGALWVGVIKERFNGDRTPKTVTGPATSAPTAGRHTVQSDWRVLHSTLPQLEQVVSEMQTLATSAPWRASGFFDAGQQDQIEGLLFRYLACRHALWHLANFHNDDDRYTDAEERAKTSAIALHAGFHVILADASLVKAFHGDAVAIAKLNEEFYRSRIPPRTYERLLLGVTNEERINALRDSFLLYSTELQDADSTIARVAKQHPEYRDLVARTKSTVHSVDALVQELIKSDSRIAPELDNRLQHTRVAELVRRTGAESGELLFAARAHLFKGISRIKNPETHLIQFSGEQKRQLYDALEPGDIILTFTAGYISDIFIPGAFKHAITYVGSPQDRRDAGLVDHRLAWLPTAEREVILESVAVAALPSGQPADVIEAVGEGVIFNHLGHILDTHVNRLVVLRPQVDHEQRTHALANVFLFLDDEYDFRFDFADASKQVCTEVVYRAFDGKGPIRFSLVQRAGHETLSADDIVNDYLASPGESFAFVLFAAEAPHSPGHRARILKGDVGTRRLMELMSETHE